ncbi:MAG: hypothetical protein L0221_14915, partial [Chloroflexi bacterium]|nr:hypothetical protein [Chloroflexota bacterium]
MQIIEQDDRRDFATGGGEEHREPVQEMESIAVGVSRQWPDVGRKLWEHPRYLRSPGHRPEGVLPAGAQVLPQRLDERPERRDHLVVTVPVQDGCSVGASGPAELDDQPRLADPGFAA